MTYMALSINIKDSRLVNNRNVLHTTLQKTCNDINKIYKNSIASQFDIILGDEIQGLLYYTTDCMDLLECFFPLGFKMQIGIGIGSVTTDINKVDVEKNDGPSFHMSRDAVTASKKAGNNRIIILPEDYSSLENLLNLYFLLMSNLSDHAITILKLLKEAYTQKEISQHIGSNQSSVSRTISRSNLLHIINLKESIKDYMTLKLQDKEIK